MTDAVLPALVDLGTPGSPLVVRCFPAQSATEFPWLPQAARRATPAIVRQLFATAAKYADEPESCLICEQAGLIEGRTLIALEAGEGFEIGVICADCARLGELAIDQRAEVPQTRA